MSSKISLGQIKFNNVFSVRKKMTEEELQEELAKIFKFFEKNDIGKTGPLITSTFSVEMDNDRQVLDIEIMIPIDREIKMKGAYKVKKVFHLVHALRKRHRGNPATLQNTYDELLEFMEKKNLQQITSAYNVNVREATSMDDIDNVIIDVYIGINPSKL